FFQAEDGIRDATVTGVQTCALPISAPQRIRKCLTEVLVSPKCVASDFAVHNTGTMLGPCTWRIALILLVRFLALTPPTFSHVVHGVDSGYGFNDEHVHLTNYIQEGT